jgi:hypothetical protein
MPGLVLGFSMFADSSHSSRKKIVSHIKLDFKTPKNALCKPHQPTLTLLAMDIDAKQIALEISNPLNTTTAVNKAVSKRLISVLMAYHVTKALTLIKASQCREGHH